MVPVLWNAMTSDWEEPSADTIASRLTRTIDKLASHGWAANLVLHDGGHLSPTAHRAASISAAGQLVTHFKPTNKFVTLDAWN